MLPKAKWLPNLLGLSLKKEKEAHPNEQQEGEEENTLTDDSTGSDAPTFIINDDLPVEANDGVTPETKKRNWSIQCNCCEQELRPGINCIPTSPVSTGKSNKF